MTLSAVGISVPLHQAETGTTQEEPQNPILPEADELIFGALAFLLVFLVLARYAFPRLSQGMRARTEKVKEDLERAEGQRTEAEGLVAQYEERLREARSEASRLIDEARKTAEGARKDLLAKAEDESKALVARAQEEIRAERDRAFEELRRHVGELSVELAARVVGESLDKERHKRLVEGYIDELTGGPRKGTRAKSGRASRGKTDGG